MATANGLTVVKCGGSDAIDADRVCADIAVLRATGEQVVVVHGGASDIGRLADELGVVRRILRSPPPHPDVDRRVRRQQTSGDVAPRLRGRKVFSESQDSFARFLRALDQHANARGGRA